MRHLFARALRSFVNPIFSFAFAREWSMDVARQGFIARFAPPTARAMDTTALGDSESHVSKNSIQIAIARHVLGTGLEQLLSGAGPRAQEAWPVADEHVRKQAFTGLGLITEPTRQD